MPTTEPMTNGEIARSLVRIEKSLEHVTEKMDTRPSWEDVKRIETALAADIRELQDTQKWAMRLVIGAVLLALISLVIGGTTAVA